MKEKLSDYEKLRLDYIWKHDEKVNSERDKKFHRQAEEGLKLQKTIIKMVTEQNKVLYKILTKLVEDKNV